MFFGCRQSTQEAEEEATQLHQALETARVACREEEERLQRCPTPPAQNLSNILATFTHAQHTNMVDDEDPAGIYSCPSQEVPLAVPYCHHASKDKRSTSDSFLIGNCRLQTKVWQAESGSSPLGEQQNESQNEVAHGAAVDQPHRHLQAVLERSAIMPSQQHRGPIQCNHQQCSVQSAVLAAQHVPHTCNHDNLNETR